MLVFMRRTPFVTAAMLALLACLGCQEDAGEEAAPTIEERPAGSDLTYVALGDSYSSAPGVPVTDPADPCMRSTNNYPSMVADQLKIETYVDVTCGGATTEHMTVAQHEGVAPQLDAVTSEADLVTLGIGGNDSSVFFTAIYQCAMIAGEDPQGSPCADQASASDADVDTVLATTQQSIETVVAEIRKRAPQAQVVLVGYPQLVPETGTCPELPLASGDYAWAREVNKKLTDAVAAAAKATDADYADVWAPSEGHDVCADQPWVNGAQNDEHAAAYHPRIEEQEAAADLVVKAFRTAS